MGTPPQRLRTGCFRPIRRPSSPAGKPECGGRMAGLRPPVTDIGVQRPPTRQVLALDRAVRAVPPRPGLRRQAWRAVERRHAGGHRGRARAVCARRDRRARPAPGRPLRRRPCDPRGDRRAGGGEQSRRPAHHRARRRPLRRKQRARRHRMRAARRHAVPRPPRAGPAPLRRLRDGRFPRRPLRPHGAARRARWSRSRPRSCCSSPC